MAHTTQESVRYALLLTDAEGPAKSELVELLYGGTLALSNDGTVIDADHTAAALLESNHRDRLLGRRLKELLGVNSADVTASNGTLVSASCGSPKRRVYFISLGDMCIEAGSLDARQALLKSCCAQAIARISPSATARSLTLDDLAGLPDAIRYSRAGMVERQTLDLWNMPVVFLLLVMLKGGEWLLRRRWRRL